MITTSTNLAVRQFLTSSPCFQSTMAHELGHAIGLDHTPVPTALMYFAETGVCFSGADPALPRRSVWFVHDLSINRRGRRRRRCTWPADGDVRSGCGRDPESVLDVGPRWRPTGHRLDFFSGAALVASVTVGPATSVGIPIPPGTTGSFSVRVTALSGGRPARHRRHSRSRLEERAGARGRRRLRR